MTVVVVFSLANLTFLCFFFAHDTRKEKWRSDVETALRDMVRRRDAGQLYGGDLRNAVYKGQLPLFQFVDGLHRMDLVRAAGEEA